MISEKAQKYINRSRKCIKDRQSDKVYTPRETAKQIIENFNMKGLILEPAAGDGSFYDQLPHPKDYCEIDEGIDFYNYNKKVDWIITNPPFSHFVPFLYHSLEVADNVIFYMRLHQLWTRARLGLITEMGFAMREVFYIYPKPETGFPQFGQAMAAIHWQRGWEGDVKMNRYRHY